jgi:3'-phosphoadenosine 5'-phosphosulfate sulfotransferase (PAPS reductase)/FAD synthetase
MQQEPILTAEDKSIWNTWRMTALLHSRTPAFKQRVTSAKSVVRLALESEGEWACMWSAGKDSTAMSHLICSEMGLDIELVSEKDDLDYPGEVEYIDGLAKAWGARLKILRPNVSPTQWLQEHGHMMAGDDDLHSRSAGMSKACFYNIVEKNNEGKRGVFLGLRKGESAGREKNRMTHGLLYHRLPTKHNPEGLWVATPLGDWEGLDVMAYMFSRNIPFLPVYQCVALMHAKEPWRLRKSWWVPGSSGRHGHVTWLRRYYPSLYIKLCEWMPDVKSLG